MQIEHNGRTQSATAWAREIGITYHLLRWRLQHWPKERALTMPKQIKGTRITHNGRTQSLNAWAHEIGITLQGLQARLKRGETVEYALRRK
jgi:hypothetical protein